MDYYYYRRRMACNFPMYRFPPHTVHAHTEVKKNFEGKVKRVKIL